MSHIRFNEDEMDMYEPSDSEDNYSETEKDLLKKVRNRKKSYSESEDEVLGVGTDDDSDEGSNLAASDVEGQDEDDKLPDVRAWGKDKRKFYSTDYVDADYGGFEGKDAHLAELEEEEARNLQKHLAQQLDDDDFTLEVFSSSKDVAEDSQEQPEEIIKSDLSKLSKRQKLELLRKESPEFFGLVEDFETKLKLAKEFLCPILQKYKRGEIQNSSAIDFVQTEYELILNYSTNIYMYLLLKSSRKNVQNHPVIKRLYQYRQLLSQLQPVFEEIIKPQIEIILNEICDKEDEQKKTKKKKLKLLTNLTRVENPKRKQKKVSFEEDNVTKKKIKLDDEADNDENLDDESEEKVLDENEEEIGKRAITYQMAKNKGLTPHRKKEQRNPRVKHKERYRKAVIRRKGAVRQPRKELSKYGGEISGIKASVVKSVKIKT